MRPPGLLVSPWRPLSPEVAATTADSVWRKILPPRLSGDRPGCHRSCLSPRMDILSLLVAYMIMSMGDVKPERNSRAAVSWGQPYNRDGPASCQQAASECRAG